jgi:hypothetical protein
VVKNPFGFVPAVWDRHRVKWGERGGAATDGTTQALMQLNSMFSQAFDFQRKVFFAPIIVKGQLVDQATTAVSAARPPKVADIGASLPSSINFLQGGVDADIVQPTFDIGKTLEMLKEIREGILAENPEASFYQQMREMSNVSAPGAEQMMGDVKNRTFLARAGYDMGTVKLFQMAISMCGYHANNGSWGKELTARQQAFKPYTIDSYKKGEMDMTIASRPIVPLSEGERLDIVLKKESIQTQWGLEQLGLSEDEAIRILEERENQFEVVATAAPAPTGPQPNGPVF